MQEHNANVSTDKKNGHNSERKTVSMRNGICRMLAALISVAAVSVLIEIFVFNDHAWKQERYTLSTESGETETVLELSEDRYIKTITLDMVCEKHTPFELRIYRADGTLSMSIREQIDARLDECIVNVRDVGSRIEITWEQAPESVYRITAANFFEWNAIRLTFLLSAFGLAAWFLLGHRLFEEKPEIVFMVICFLMGILLILISGTNQISYDEQTHVAKTWNLSFVGTVYDTQASLECKTLTVPVFDNIWEKRLVEAHLDEINRYDTANIFYQTKMISYEKRAYLPMAVCMAFARLLQLPFAGLLSFAKLGNLLMYTLICAMAIRIAKKGKGLVAVVSLLPNSIFSASQFSYDPCVNCFLILAMVLVMNEILEPQRSVRPGNMAAILACFIIGSYSKQVYILMALLMLFFSCRKFPSKAKAVLFKVILTALCLIMVYEVLAPSYSGTSAAATLSHAGDSRTEGANTMGQIGYILGNPLGYVKLLLTSMFGRIGNWFTGRHAFIMYGYLGTPGTLYTWIWFAVWIFAAAVAPAAEERKGIGRKFVILNAVMVFCMSAVIWTVLYLSFNAVANPRIEGVQDRYFSPLFLPAGMCLMNAGLSWKWSREAYYKLIFGICSLILLYCSWKVGISAYYL